MKSTIMFSKPGPPFGSPTDREKGPGIGKVLFVTNRIHIWKKKILQLCFLNVDFQTLEKIASRLDVDGRDILWYLWEKGHARINELAELIEAPNHMHVLLVIRDTINPVAEKEVGCPVLSFERQKVDPDTGGNHSFQLVAGR